MRGRLACRTAVHAVVVIVPDSLVQLRLPLTEEPLRLLLHGAEDRRSQCRRRPRCFDDRLVPAGEESLSNHSSPILANSSSRRRRRLAAVSAVVMERLSVRPTARPRSFQTHFNVVLDLPKLVKRRRASDTAPAKLPQQFASSL